jgi:hypothetical protein
VPRRFIASLFVLGSSLSSIACGARTGLEAPAISLDAAVEDAATDAAVPPRVLCVEPPVTDGAIEDLRVALSIEARVGAADVLFVVDRTGSMSEEIDNIRQSLRSVIVPGLIRAIPDLNLGLVTYGDFPVEPYGSMGDRPFSLERPMSREFTALQGALGAVRAEGGGDQPEALVEALFQVATGQGLRAGRVDRPWWIEPAGGCRLPGNGYACARPRATPILVLVTDAPTHNGPGGTEPYTPSNFIPSESVPHTYEQAVAALNAGLGAKLVGIFSGTRGAESGRATLEALSRDTRSLDRTGRPLVFDINPDGSGLSQQVVTSVTRLVDEVRLDVSARAVDADGSGGASFVRAVRARAARPASNVEAIEGARFGGVVPGTLLDFELEVDRALIPRRPRTTEYRIRVEFLEQGRPTLGSTEVILRVPGLGEQGCAP